ncbi:MAG: hypothetical protein ACI8PT_001891 [Gammaproteobacteria bacterium]|jgi:hypothetical protein
MKARATAWALLMLIIALVVFGVTVKTGAWHYLGVPHLVPDFLDFHALLAASDCHQQGIDVYQINPCDHFNRPMVYSHLWFALGDLGFTRADNPMLGFSLSIAFLVCAGAAVRPTRAAELLFGLAIVLSPAVMLGVERANNDLAMFILIWLATSVMSNAAVVSWRAGAAYALIWLATFLKFYPLAGLAVLIGHIHGTRQLGLVIVVSSLIFGAFVAIHLEDFRALAESVPRPIGRWTYGVRSLTTSLGADSLAPIVIAILAIFTGALSWVLARRLTFTLDNLTPGAVNLYLACGAILIGCYFVNNNYDYRLVFLIGLLPVVFALWRSADTSAFTRLVVLIVGATMLTATWAESAVDIAAWLGGDERGNFLMAARRHYPTISVIEHVTSWIMIVGIAALGLRIVHQSPWRAWLHTHEHAQSPGR